MENEWHEYLAAAHRPSAAAEAIVREVVDAAFVVHRELGPGFLESIYERALSIELEQRGVAFQRQLIVPVHFRGIVVGEHRLDLLVADLVVVELKAQREPIAQHVTQVISYLKATRLDLGLIVNFGMPTIKAGLKRVVLAPFKP